MASPLSGLAAARGSAPDWVIPVPGQRLLVPFGRGSRVGIFLELAHDSEQDPSRLKPIERVLDPDPVFRPVDLALVRWAAVYYRVTLGEALFCALPSRLRQARPSLEQGMPGLVATPEGLALDLAHLRRAPRQRDLLALLRESPRGLATRDLNARLGPCAAAVRALRAHGLIVPCLVAVETGLGVQTRDPSPAPDEGERPGADPRLRMGPDTWQPPNERPEAEAAFAHEKRPALAAALGVRPELNPEQSVAVDRLVDALGAFRPFLLDGVTGSGKTEVYLRVIEAAIARDLQTLLIVPEIGLTPQLRARLDARLPSRPLVLHSGLGERERERVWHQAASGRASVVIGTRSAIFVPMPRLGLVLVDEEHDLSLKQQEGFRYSARDLAVRRAQLVGCPVVLGSATPSLETLANMHRGRYMGLHLPKRAGVARRPKVSLLDIRNQPLQAGLSRVLREEMRTEIAVGNQVLLFLNRRGFAPVLTCHACGWIGDCPHCDARPTLHLRQRRLWCHHCGWFQAVPDLCPACQGQDLRMLGRGTERLDEELRGLFPGTCIARVDRDSIRRKGDLDRLLEQARRGEVQILLGTQMLAKGHDFPSVTLVGILDLDQALYAGDFRAPERTAQLIVQVAGRAGRAERPGRVVLQTRHPDHPLLQSLLHEGYAGFAAAALIERRAADLPPYSHLALLRAEAPVSDAALAFLEQCRALTKGTVDEVQILGPVPAPMERRAGRHRAQLLVQSSQRPALHHFLDQWLPSVARLPKAKGLRWSLDVDPQEMS